MVASIFNLLSGPGLIIILVVVFFFYGGKRMPELVRSIRKSIDDFKEGKRDGIAPDQESSKKPK